MLDPPSPRLRRTWSLCLLRGYTFLFVSFLRCAFFRCYTYAFNFQARQFATMSNCAVIPFPPFELERDNLLVLALFENVSGHFYSGDQRVAARHVLAIGEHEHVTEGRSLTRIDTKKIHLDRVAFRDAKLPAASLDNCVSHKLSKGRKAAQSSTGRRVWQT